MTELCACGQPLHYGDPKIEALVRRMIREADGDSYVTVSTPQGSWRVQRHYIALHGLQADQLPRLAIQLGFEPVQ